MANLDWKIATLVESRHTATDIKSLFFEIEGWENHKAGQHCDIRLTASEGYQAQRAYSIVSGPGEKLIEFGVQILENGEVSPYLWKMQPGDQVEIKGPLGGHFIWTPEMPGPLVLIGGGSGICPLLSINKAAHDRKIIFIESANHEDKIMYFDQLKDKLITRITSKEGHIDEAFLASHISTVKDEMPMVYICGPTPFVETAANAIVKIGINPHLVRTERFG
jgi:ferredoxin-NADP reductase